MSRPGGDTPNPARVYDYVLNGPDDARYSLPADRAFARALIKADPTAVERTRRNRAFVVTVARRAAQAGIRQFADLGCGLPATPGVPAAVLEAAPGARVAAVDHDPFVVARWASAGISGVTPLLADISDPDTALKTLPLDLDEPVCVLLGSVLHLLGDPETAVDTFKAAISARSWMAISVPRYRSAGQLAWTQAATRMPVRNLSAADLEKMLSGMNLLEPGVVEAKCWMQGICHEPRGGHTLVGAAVKPVLAADETQRGPGGRLHCLAALPPAGFHRISDELGHVPVAFQGRRPGRDLLAEPEQDGTITRPCGGDRLAGLLQCLYGIAV